MSSSHTAQEPDELAVQVEGNEPDYDCARCPRLQQFRDEWRTREPDWFNGPVPTFSVADPKLIIVGLAPGLRGANKTGRPFTGDYAGDLLYATLHTFGFARGTYAAHAQDGLELVETAITNAVRCVPPQNKPVGAEIRACRSFLTSTLRNTPSLSAIVALGRIAHDATLSALDLKRSAFPFGHGAKHALDSGLTLYDSYHCSRYNTNTRRLTPDMFEAVFAEVAADLRPANSTVHTR